MLGVVDTFILEVERLESDLDTLLNNPGDSAESAEFTKVLLDGIATRINTISFCIGKMYESSHKIQAGALPGRDIITGFVSKALMKLSLKLILANNRAVGVSIPIVSKMNSQDGIHSELEKLLELVKSVE